MKFLAWLRGNTLNKDEQHVVAYHNRELQETSYQVACSLDEAEEEAVELAHRDRNCPVKVYKLVQVGVVEGRSPPVYKEVT